MKSSLKSVFALLFCLVLLLFASCSAPQAPEEEPPSASEPAVQEIGKPAHTKETGTQTPKYIFLFIGDGMSFAQVNAAQIYKSSLAQDEMTMETLNFADFPVTGMMTTYDATSFCPDSASAGTALSCGIKTQSGVLGLAADKETQPKNIVELLKEDGRKIGIVSTVAANHATPAAFYAHVPSRGDYYDIAMQMAESGVDYFGGGSLIDPAGSDGDQEDAFEVLKQNGYNVADTKEEIMALGGGSGKAYAVSPVLQGSTAMPYSLDMEEGDLSLADFVSKGIDVLDNENGFFMVCESGMIDWACHANDAMTAIAETLVLEDAVEAALGFAKEHPRETLIVVTADHETGGMAIGYAATGYDTNFSILEGQTLSYTAFNTVFSEMKKSDSPLMMSDVLPVVKQYFGLIAPDDPDAALARNADRVLTAYEYEKLTAALSESLGNGDAGEDELKLLYGGYEPLTVTLTHILNNKAGIGWTTYAHTGGLVPVFAYGADADAFSGSYDNTDIFAKLVSICGL
jgi:alkaline phosphatase